MDGVNRGSLDDEFPESPPRQGFKEEYLAAIDRAVFGGMKFRTLADSQKTLDWPRLLPWLSRDQEAHFSGLLEWRHKDSDHNSPELSHEDACLISSTTIARRSADKSNPTSGVNS